VPACASTPGVSPCYQVAVIDSTHPYEGTHDEPFVSHVTLDPDGDYQLHLVKADMSAYTLANSYTFSPYPAFDSGNSAGVGVMGAGEYVPQFGDMWQAYDDAFVEYWIPPAGCGKIPYLPPAFFDGYNVGANCTTGTVKGDLSAWFRFGRIWYAHHAEPNYFWVGGVGTTAPIDAVNCQVCSGANPTPQIFGITMATPYTTESFVFAGALEAYCATGTKLGTATYFLALRLCLRETRDSHLFPCLTPLLALRGFKNIAWSSCFPNEGPNFTERVETLC